MTRPPEKCKHPHKSWLTLDQARRKGLQYRMSWYKCYDHWHIGHRRQPGVPFPRQDNP